MLYQLFPDLNRQISKYDFSKIVQLCLNRSNSQDTISITVNSTTENPIEIETINEAKRTSNTAPKSMRKRNYAAENELQQEMNPYINFKSALNGGSKEYLMSQSDNESDVKPKRNIIRRNSKDGVKVKNIVKLYANGTMKLINPHANTIYDDTDIYPIPEDTVQLPTKDIMLSQLIPIMDEENNGLLKIALRYANDIPVSYEGFSNTKSVPVSKLLTRNIERLLKLNTMDEELRHFYENYLAALNFATKEISNAQGNNMKLINLTDTLMSSLRRNSVPAGLINDLEKLYRYLLVDMKNEDLSGINSRAETKGEFIKELFDYLSTGDFVDDNIKKLIKFFTKFVSSDEKLV